ncbi:unnamed protein product, partial [Adineta steineri]
LPRSPMLDVYDEKYGATDAKRKYMKRYSVMDTSLLNSTSAPQSDFHPTREGV